jgi:hypothetical protein
MYTADLNILLVYTNIFQIIFPRPQSGSQVLSLTRGQLWRGSLDATRDPDEVLNLDLDLLRDEASNALVEMGLTPAT